jgi:uncharacterized protein YbcI
LDITEQSRQELGPVVSRISREVVQLHANLYGRGPTRAKTHLNEDYALCILDDVFTPAERTLIVAGHAAQVQATRAAFQDAVGPELIAVAETATGRKVRSFISSVHIETEVAVELWLFEPVPMDGDGDGADPAADGAGLPDARRAAIDRHPGGVDSP